MKKQFNQKLKMNNLIKCNTSVFKKINNYNFRLILCKIQKKKKKI